MNRAATDQLPTSRMGSWFMKPIVWWLGLALAISIVMSLLGIRYLAGYRVIFASGRHVEGCRTIPRFASTWTTRIPALKAFEEVYFVAIAHEPDRTLPWLRYQPRLKEMFLFGGGCSSHSYVTLADCCSQLEELYIHSASLSQNDCRQLARLSKLRDMSFRGDVASGGFTELYHLADLVRFGLQPHLHRPSDAVLHELAGMPQVRRLYLHVSDSELNTLLSPGPDDPPVLPSIRQLHFGPTVFCEQTVAKLQTLPNLTHLTLSETRIDDEAVRQLTHLTNLRQLYLAHCPITDEGCQPLAKLTNLESLHLGATGITIEGVRRLTVLPRLRHLVIKECGKIRDQSEIESLPTSFRSRCRIVR